MTWGERGSYEAAAGARGSYVEATELRGVLVNAIYCASFAGL